MPSWEAVLVSQQPPGSCTTDPGEKKARSVRNPKVPDMDWSAKCGERRCLSSDDTAEDLAPCGKLFFFNSVV